MATNGNKNRNKGRKSRFYKRKGFWLSGLLLCLIVGLAGWIFADQYTREYRRRASTYDLSKINELEIPSLIFDRTGKEIGRIFVQNRSIIPIDEVPEVFINALLAGEDSRFLSHQGVDYIGIIRAVKLNYQGSTQGASTITQQLARNAYNLKEEAVLRQETKIQRKLVEAFLAMRIEKRYSKREILNFYLNRIYFGSGFYGIRSAALGYFGKEPMQLSTEECASMVTLIKYPNGRSPINDPDANRQGRNYVLGRMREEGMISRSELARLKSLPLKLNPRPLRRGTSHLYERVAEAVGSALGEDALATGGYKIHTTILADAQNAALKSLLESLAKAESRPGYSRQKYADYRKDSSKPAEYLQGAVLMVDHETGEVLAHVGGRDYAQVPYDFIELGKRPLGTAFFPYIYAAGFGGGLNPATLVEDEPMDNRAVMVGGREGILGEWGMEIPSPVYEGRIPARRALETSKIAATVRFAGQTGLQRVVDTSVAFGLPMKNVELLPRLCVGWEEVSMKQAVRGMMTFPLGGQTGPKNLTYLDRVENSAGRVIFRRRPPAEPVPQRVIDEATAWQVHSMMASSLVRGSSAGALAGMLEKPFTGAGKGGTTHDFSDTWFIGYNKRITCGVWTGFLMGNGGPIYPGAFSRDLSLPVWQAAMNAAAPSFGGGELIPPASVVQLQVCATSGQRATQFCQAMEEDISTGNLRSRSTASNEYFRKGNENLPFCSVHSGAIAEDISPGSPIYNIAVAAVPVRPKEPVVIGDDPYHTEIPSFAATSSEVGLVRRRTNVLDSLDLGDKEESIPLKRPPRLKIEDD